MFADNSSLTAYFPMAQPYTDSVGVKLLGWNIPPEHSELVHPHWRGYEAPAKFMHYALALLYLILMALSVTGNGIVVWIFSTSKSLKTASNMFIVNLAIFDLLMMLEMPMFIANSFSQRLLGYETGCDVYAVLGSLSGMGGAITNAVIAYDRYKTISCPLDGRLSKTQAAILIGFTWIWTIPFTVLPLFKIWGRYVPEGFLTTCSFDYLTDDSDTRVFVACIFTWSYVIPMLLILFFYSQLFQQVRGHERMLKEQAKKMNVKSLVSNQDPNRSAEIRIAKVAFTIFFLFVCSWTPYAVVTMMGAFGNRELITPLSTMIPAICAKIVSCLDPWVYAINHPRYRAELTKRVPWLGVRESDTSDSVSQGTTASSAAAPTE